MLGDETIDYEEFDTKMCSRVVALDIFRFSKDERLKENLMSEISKFE